MTQEQTEHLRFPEFRDSGAWEVNDLEKLAYFVNKKISLELVPLSNFISTENILPDYKGTRLASKLPQSGSVTQFQINDILISNIRPYLKKVWFSDKDGGASNDVIIVRAKEKVDALYLSFMLKNDVFINYIMRGAKGVKMPRGDISLIKKYSLVCPSPAEQKKIATCLSALDEVINAEVDNLGSLKDYKKGLLQQLFPNNKGDKKMKEPKIRFPEFQGKDSWKVKELKEVLTSISNGLNLGQVNEVTDYKVTRIETISHRVINTEKVGYVKPEQDISSYKLSIGDILFSNINSLAHIGKTVIVDRDYDLYHGMNLLRFVIDKNLNNPRFMYYLLNTAELKLSFKMRANKAVNQASINQTELGKTRVIVPPLSEQQKIADCLSSLDELITVQEEKLETLKQHKVGLMQQLFPKI